MSEQDNMLVITPEFKAKVKAFNKDWHSKYKNISKEKTPQVDGTGRKIIDRRPDGFDYIIEAYMREALDKHFPGWSWVFTAPLQFLGSSWVVKEGELWIPDEHLLAFGIKPPVRRFNACGAARIQFKRGTPHTPENIVDVDKNVKAANSAALKKAINQLTHIGDDVYGKRIEEEGMGTIDEVLSSDTMTPAAGATTFNEFVKQRQLKWSEVFEILEVKSMSEIKDFSSAYKKLKEVLDARHKARAKVD